MKTIAESLDMVYNKSKERYDTPLKTKYRGEMRMIYYEKFISEKRKSVPTPKSLIDENGQVVFGTFDKEFEMMQLTKANHPVHALFPNFLNKSRLTLWEASEIHLEQGVLLSVVCDMTIFGMILYVFYDKRTKKVTSWSTNLPSKKTVIAPNLLNGSIAEAKTEEASVQYVNHFEQGKSSLKGHFNSKKAGSLEVQIDFERLSLPCVVSIPFGKNKPLYSQKDFFKITGYIVVNGERMETSGASTGVIDDHRGYYPYRMHYDWVTTMGKTIIDGKESFIAFNLTRNQSINQEDYNENLIWLEGKTSLLPPVNFERNPEDTVWTIKDEHDMVNLTFDVRDKFLMIAKPLVILIDYHVAFGEIKGYIRDTTGKKYVLDGMMGMGEDKTMRF